MIHEPNQAVAETDGGLVTDVQETRWGGEHGAINQLRRRQGGAAKQDPRKLNWPGQASSLRAQSILQPAVHAFHHAVGLRVEGGGEDVVDAKLLTEVRPDGGGELGPSVSGDGGRHAETGDPSSDG